MAVNKFFLITSGVTALIIIILVVVTIVMYTKRTVLFTPYTYNNMDAKGTRYAPNGFESTSGTIDPAIQGIIKAKLQLWEASSPGSDSNSFGYYGQS